MRIGIAETLAALGLCTVLACGGSTAKGAEDSGQPEGGSKRDTGTKDTGTKTDTGTPDTDAQQPNDGGIINDAAPGVCPATYAIASQPAMCSHDSAECNYDKGSCVCNAGTLPSNTLSWDCTPLNSGCPFEVPVANSPCTTTGLLCSYGPCGKTALMCTDGVWSEEGSAGCPGP
jgi:hypothetical protein